MMMRESLVSMLANKLANGQLHRFRHDPNFDEAHAEMAGCWRRWIDMYFQVGAFGLEELQTMIEAESSGASLKMFLDSTWNITGSVGRENAARTNRACKKFFNLGD